MRTSQHQPATAAGRWLSLALSCAPACPSHPVTLLLLGPRPAPVQFRGRLTAARLDILLLSHWPFMLLPHRPFCFTGPLQISISSDNSTLSVGAGASNIMVQAAIYDSGIPGAAVPSGVCSYVGVSGG